MTNRNVDTDPMRADAEAVAEVLKAMAHPARLRLLAALAGGPRTVGQLQAVLDATQPFVSGQLMHLRTAGVVTCFRSSDDARTMFYALSEAQVGPTVARLYDVFGPS